MGGTPKVGDMYYVGSFQQGDRIGPTTDYFTTPDEARNGIMSFVDRLSEEDKDACLAVVKGYQLIRLDPFAANGIGVFERTSWFDNVHP